MTIFEIFLKADIISKKNHANYNQCACVNVYVIEQSDNDVV